MEFDINDRIRQVMEAKDLSPSAFAETIGVSRPLVSHILSHRNKAGVEMLQKVLEQFNDIDAAWLLTGKGNKYVNKQPEEAVQSVEVPAKQEPQELENDGFSKNKQLQGKKTVKRIILFFSDGSFEVTE